MGRNKTITCRKCFRVMRSDHLNRHLEQHEKENYQNETICSSSITSSTTTLNKESNFSLDTTKTYEVTPLKSEEMTKTMIKDDEEYKYNVACGKKIYEDVNKYGIKEESLRREYKELLDMYMKQRNMIDIDNVILRTWQTALLEYMVPTNREVIWIIGTKGNEGKSWFQEFLESKFGWHRVICSMDIKMKKGNICQALRKRSLMTTNMFLFDVGKGAAYEGVNYDVLEKIKNGRIVADKYNTAELKFQTPNIVIVFSNEKPDTGKLSKDRWKIFKIIGEDLADVSPISTAGSGDSGGGARVVAGSR